MPEAIPIPLSADFSEFNAVWSEYIKVTRRDFATAANTKAYYIALRAIRETPKADKLAIGKALSPILYTFDDKGGKRLRTVQRYSRLGLTQAVPIAALIINAQRASRGKPGLYGAKMARAIKNLVTNRQRTVSFLKAGWIPAVKTLAPYAERAQAPDMGPKPTAVGKPKGYGVAALPGLTPVAIIANSIGSQGVRSAKQTAALQKYGQPALQRAVNAEAASMLEYLDKKAREAARRVGIETR